MTVSKINRGRCWAASLVCATVLVAAGCSSNETAQPATTSAAATTATSETQAASGAVTISDTWVKATAGTEDPSMTAAFGVLKNNSDKDLTIVSATNSVSDRTELHEMAMEGGSMVMRPIAGGIAIPAGGSTTLEPGGLHVMIMDVKRPITPGEQIDVNLTLSDGSTVAFQTLAKEFSGANEEYNGGETTGGGMDMGGATTAMHMSQESTGEPMNMGGSTTAETASTDG